MKPLNIWTIDMIELLFFLRDELKYDYKYCLEEMKREYPKLHFTEAALRKKYSRNK